MGQANSSELESSRAAPQFQGSLLADQNSASPSPSPSPSPRTQSVIAESLKTSFGSVFDEDYPFNAQSNSGVYNYSYNSYPQYSGSNHRIIDDGLEISIEGDPSQDYIYKAESLSISTSCSSSLVSSSASSLSSSSSNMSTPSAATQPLVIEDGCIVYQVKKNDTLEGIAVSFHVKVEEIKQKNRLWSKNDLFARKKILIPFSSEFEKLRNAQNNSKPKEAQETRSTEVDKVAYLSRFVKSLKCKEEIAFSFLESNGWDFDSAVDAYIENLGRSVAAAPSTAIKGGTRVDNNSYLQTIKSNVSSVSNVNDEQLARLGGTHFDDL